MALQYSESLQRLGLKHNILVTPDFAQKLWRRRFLEDAEDVVHGGNNLVIFLDKTAVAASQVDVDIIYINDQMIQVPHTMKDWEKVADSSPSLLQDIAFDLMLKCMTLCNIAHFDGDKDERGNIVDSGMNINMDIQHCGFRHGDRCDRALLRMVECTPTVQHIRKRYMDRGSDNGNTEGHVFGTDVIRECFPKANENTSDIPFTGTYKVQCSVFRNSNLKIDEILYIDEEGMGGGERGKTEKSFTSRDMVLMKGSADRVLRRCSGMLIDGSIVVIEDGMRDNFRNVMDSLGEKGYILIAFAYRELANNDIISNEDDICYIGKSCATANYPVGQRYSYRKINNDREDDSLVFIGIAGLINLPRPSIAPFVNTAKCHGFKVHMLSSDHPSTAMHLAKSVGILTEEKLLRQKAVTMMYSELETQRREIVIEGEDISYQGHVSELLRKHDEIVLSRIACDEKFDFICHGAGESFHDEPQPSIVFIGGNDRDESTMFYSDIGVALGLSSPEDVKEAADLVILDDDLTALSRLYDEYRLLLLARQVDLQLDRLENNCCVCS